jgi:chitosanase
MEHFDIPCTDCAGARERLERAGFKTHGCTPMATEPGMCQIHFSPAAETELESMMGAATASTAASRAKGAAKATTKAATKAGTKATTAATGALSLTPTQARTAQAIVNLFETGHVLGDYGQVTLLEGDSGRLTYGRSQTTLGSGLLLQLLQQYVGNPGARFGRRLAPWLPAVAAAGPAVDTDGKLHNLLRACADDPVMRETQDAFFDSRYWQPALRVASREGLRSALAVAVVYDSQVHGSWPRMRDTTVRAVGTPAQVGEKRWITAYVQQRRSWLATHSVPILRQTVYRMDAFQRLIDLNQWGLMLPLVLRGAEISTATLSGLPPGCYDGPVPGSRPLMLAQPLARGLDARLLQLSLSDRGAQVKADGVFGRASAEAIRQLQIIRGLPATGVADAALIAALLA